MYLKLMQTNLLQFVPLLKPPICVNTNKSSNSIVLNKKAALSLSSLFVFHRFIESVSIPDYKISINTKRIMIIAPTER
jgi:hypothetical protein